MDSTNPAAPEGAEEVKSVSIGHVLEVLSVGAVVAQHGLVGWSSNDTALVSITDGMIELLAVYKPRRGERPLWDFPRGTLCNREVAAFLVSAALGWDIVPPTVLRDGPKGPGSVQLFIHHDPDVHYFTLTDDDGLHDRLKQFAAFDVITNNADRKSGHFVRDAQGHLWGIDHGLTFNVVPKLRTVMWNFADQPVPEAILVELEDLSAALDAGAGLRCALDNLLAPEEIRITQARVRRLLEAKRYPKPGAGPSYPWPPV